MHSIWVSPKGNPEAAVIMGGWGNAKTTERIFYDDGTSLSKMAYKHFPLKYDIE